MQETNSGNNQQHYGNRISSVTHEYLNEQGTSRVTSKVRAYRILNKTYNKSRVEMQECKSLCIRDTPSRILLPKPSYNSTPQSSGHTYSTIKTQCSRRRQNTRQSPHHFTKFRKTYFCTRSPSRVSAGYSKCTHKVPRPPLIQFKHARKTNITPETQNKPRLIVPVSHISNLHKVGRTHTTTHITMFLLG